jgi:hypothetical protein
MMPFEHLQIPLLDLAKGVLLYVETPKPILQLGY